MALADFIQALQEQDVVYSTPPQPSIRVIPPEQQFIKIIPPESLEEQPQQVTPKVIKLKIKQKPASTPDIVSNANQTTVESNNVQPVQQQQPKLQPVQHKPVLQPVQKEQPVQQTVRVQPVKQEPVIQQAQYDIPKYEPKVTQTPKPQSQPVVQQEIKVEPVQPKELTDEDIFNSTGTEYSKKTIWFEYFEKAKNSRKSNPIVDRMKVGRFTITPDNKVLLLPDYDIVGKDPDDVLKDKWF